MIKPCTIVGVHLLNDFSGSPLVFMQSLKTLRDRNVMVELHTAGSGGGFLDQLNLRKRTYPYRFFNNRFLRLLAFLFSQIFLFFSMWRYWRRDVIIYVNTLLPFGAGLAGWLMGKKVVYHIHERYIQPAALKFFLRKVASWSADQVIYVSEYLMREEKIEGVKGAVVHNALPDEFVRHAAQNTYAASNQQVFTVLMVCSLKDYKGIPEFVQLAIRHPDLQFELVLNSDEKSISRYFVNTAKPANLTLFAVQTNLDSFYRRASLVVNLTNPGSCVETFGMTILEAMAYGVPVLAPPVGGPLELVEEERNGFTVDVRDEKLLDSRIHFLSSNPALMQVLSCGARRTASRFARTTFDRKIEGVFSCL